MNAKQLFNQDKELTNQWSAVCHAAWFQQVLVFAMSEFTEGDVTKDQLDGAKKFRDALLDLAETPKVGSNFPKSGLVHNIPEAIAQQLESKK